jgi:ubiquinone/menaquinone biosynthesis C-methylase UbiE
MWGSEHDKVEVRQDSPALMASSTDPWEAAYLRFETAEEEIDKFVRRLRKLGAGQWAPDANIVELFCGRGNGLHALERMGFVHLTGVDLSPRLLKQYSGSAICILGDCRHLPFADQSKDFLIIQGGLHHLQLLPADLDQTLSESQRVLRKDGRVVIVEPWLTPFLRFVHWIAMKSMARRISGKLDALATMIHYEQRTYEQWLCQPDLITNRARTYFSPIQESFEWGKWYFVGIPR